MDSRTRRRLRGEATRIAVTLQVGKDGLSEELIDELARQLKKRRTVKVRLLPSAAEATGKALAEATKSELVDERGHTVVLHRP